MFELCFSCYIAFGKKRESFKDFLTRCHFIPFIERALSFLISF